MTRKHNKVLVVSLAAYPLRAGSAVIMENLARQFSREEMVVFSELSMFGKPLSDRPLNSPEFHYFRSGISLFGRGARFFESLRWRLFPRLVVQTCQLATSLNCTHILGVYPDDMYCYAAQQAAEKLGLPFSTYFHNTYLDNAAISKKRAAEIQPQLLARSDCVFVMSEAMKRFYEEKYRLPNCVPLVHSFAEFPPVEHDLTCKMACNGRIRLVLIGNFNQSNIEATKRFVDAVSKDRRFEINFYTDVPKVLLRRRGIDLNKIRYRGYVEDTLLVEELRKYDIIVLTHGFSGDYGDVEYRTIFPTRTIPMLLSGRPILVHSPPAAYLTEYFCENQCAIVVDEPSEDAILSGLQRIADDTLLRAGLVKRANVAAKEFYGPRVAAVLRYKLWGQRSAYSSAGLVSQAVHERI
jgi:hypothetical protein